MENYKITSVEFGTGQFPSNMIYGDLGNPRPGEMETNVFTVTLIQGNGKNILVDAGIDVEDPAQKAVWDSMGVSTYGTVWALEQVGLTPDDIDVLFITHMHADHVGAINRFTNAQIIIQAEEFYTCEKLLNQPEYGQISISSAGTDYEFLHKKLEDGQLTLLGGDVENICPGIDVRCFPNCHSVADQVVVVKNADAHYVIAGDLASRPANLIGAGEWTGYLAPLLGRSGSVTSIFGAYKWILGEIDGGMKKLVLTHDDTMCKRFDSAETKDGLHILHVCE